MHAGYIADEPEYYDRGRASAIGSLHSSSFPARLSIRVHYLQHTYIYPSHFIGSNLRPIPGSIPLYPSPLKRSILDDGVVPLKRAD